MFPQSAPTGFPLTQGNERKAESIQAHVFCTLPVELQIEIFSMCTPSIPKIGEDTAPALLCRVCRAWRCVIAGTPRFWSTFLVEICTDSELRERLPTNDRPNLLAIVALWLDRSKNHFLDITLRNVPWTLGDVDLKILQLLWGCADRWRNVDFDIIHSNFQFMATTLPSSLPKILPCLERLALRLKGPIQTDLRLKSNIPWHQISYLDILCSAAPLMTLDEFWDVLLQAQRLRSCSINLDCSFQQSIFRKIRTGELTVPSLNTLKMVLQCRTSSNLQECLLTFLNHLDLPDLNTLELSWRFGDRETDPWQAERFTLLPFVQTISSHLRDLTLGYLPLNDTHLRECLAQLPHLTRLELRYSMLDTEEDYITYELLEALTPSSSDDVVLPCLHSLFLSSRGTKYNDSILLKLIDSRRDKSSGAAMLQILHVLRMNSVEEELRKRVDVWREEGMAITIENLRLL
ncbi:hypothetical protein CPC08DRAFT_760904 [Agrocybe pediades]|nr:hypothetical protein CPC08DRAFT_760904 [Agrocybe pediades]